MKVERPRLPISESEMTRLNREFYNEYRTRFGDNPDPKIMQRSRRSSSPWTADPRDLSNLILQKFDRTCRTDEDFLEYVRENGVAKVASHIYFGKWIFWARVDQWKEHHRIMPRATTNADDLLLRLAAGRHDGILFPLVSNPPRAMERQLLGQLLDEKKVWEVPAADADGIWSNHETLGPVTLRLTDRGDGNGHGRLESLVNRGFFEKRRTHEPSRLWRYEENVAVTAHLTKDGRNYADSIMSGALWVTDMDLPGEDQGIEDILEDGAFERWMTPTRLIEILDFAVAAGWMPADHAEAFRLRKVGETPGDEAWTMQRVADRIGVGTSTIDRWEKKYDDLFASPETQRILLLRFPRE